MMETLFTIGAYGFTREEFFRKLVEAEIDFFCDVRRRRGMRGSLYSFANAKQLQSELCERGIQYKHIINLAPTEEIRLIQKIYDESVNDSKRKRVILSESFCRAYEEKILSTIDITEFNSFFIGMNKPVLFCVETIPEACHRSLLARKIERNFFVPVVHIMPNKGGVNDAYRNNREHTDA